MKKGLSVLLIAAALFGFYGGAVNLNDVLACKDYWEEEGEKTTADLNKLEDGLNQLKDNEEAYLDGLDQVKEGEEALAQGEEDYAAGQAELAQGEADYAAAPGKLADARAQIAKGEQDLADGEAKLAAGKKEYAQGKKDYEAAPAKLAAAKKQIKQGEKDLADGKAKLKAGKKEYAQGQKDYEEAPAKLAAGEKAVNEGKEQLKGLAALIDGINQVLNGYNDEWKPGYEKLKDGRAKLYNGSKGSIEDLTALAAFLPENAQAAYVNAVNDVAADDEKQSAEDYKDFIKSTNALADAIPKIQESVSTKLAGAKQLTGALTAASNDLVFAGTVDNQKDNLKALAALISDSSKKAQFEGAIDGVVNAYKGYVSAIEAEVTQAVTDYMTPLKGDTPDMSSEAGKAVMAKMAAGATMDEAVAAVQEEKKEEETKKAQAKYAGVAASQLAEAKAGIIGAMQTICDTLADVNDKVNGDESAIKNTLLPGLKQFNSQATEDKIDELSAGQLKLAGGVQQIAAGALSSDTLKNAIKEKMGASAITLLNAYKSNPNPLSTSISDFAAFQAQMEKTPDIISALTKAKPLLAAAKASGEETLKAGEEELAAGKASYAAAPAKLAAAKKQIAKGEKDLAAGEKKLAAGKKEYKQGLKDYEAAPAKLEAAEKAIAKGEKDLAAGKKKLADGKAQYAQGLADYAAAPAKLEAGRQALAEGLQKLMDGRADLAAGKDKLAEYEDGEQQVRDGLATLMGTEPNGGLTSILERRNGDDQFDDANGHLQLDEGLDAVEVGRGYQADSGELITEEIMGRAVGTAAGLGAAALAVLAAILSFLKKNKGAGVSAILSAAAGAAGIAYGTSHGMEFSNIAGSGAGSLPWIAFGVLAAVAAVHAITHFASKEA